MIISVDKGFPTTKGLIMIYSCYACKKPMRCDKIPWLFCEKCAELEKKKKRKTKPY